MLELITPNLQAELKKYYEFQKVVPGNYSLKMIQVIVKISSIEHHDILRNTFWSNCRHRSRVPLDKNDEGAALQGENTHSETVSFVGRRRLCTISTLQCQRSCREFSLSSQV